MTRRPSPALVISIVALFVALGGTSYAALRIPRNSVGSGQVINNSLQKADLANATVTALLRTPRNTVGSGQVIDHSLQTADLANATVTALKGDAGAQGPAGATGATGLGGLAGVTGATGPGFVPNCPTGTTRRLDLCASVPTALTSFTTAIAFCASSNRRLPTTAEVYEIHNMTGGDFTEWTNDLTDATDAIAITFAGASATIQSLNVATTGTPANPLWYHCVSTPGIS